MESMQCHYPYTAIRRGDRRIYKNDGSFPPVLSDEEAENALFITASLRNYHMVTTGDIRILSLFPGLFDDPLRCWLTVEAIEEQPVYDALSYMWGNPSDTRFIQVDTDRHFPVTVSLENALRHIRSQNSVRRVWVDAVCIDQSDIDERSSQVSLMKEIYSRARLAAVWIDVELSLDIPCVRQLLELEEHINSDDLGDDPKFWEPLIPLLQDEYWDRLWIQQELVFAPKLEFYCRGVMIPGEKLMAFQLHILRKSSQHQSLFQAPDMWTVLRNQMCMNKTFSRKLGWWRDMMKHKVPVDLYTSKPNQSLRKPDAGWQLDPHRWGPHLSTCPIYLLGMIRYSQSLKVTDPRDRTVASLNLVIDFDDDGSTNLATYEMGLAESYFRIACLLPFNCNSLQFLSQTSHLQTPDEAVKGLPSWAPNWNAPGNASYFWAPFRAAGRLPMYSTPFQGDMGEGTLHVRGFLFDEVREILSQRNNSGIPLSKLASFSLPESGTSLDASNRIKRLADTLIGPSLAENNLPQKYFSIAEMTLYTGILLSYGLVTPGLRICDLSSHNNESHNRFQSIRTTITTLRNFKECYPPILNRLNLDRLSSAIPRKVNQIQRFQNFIHLVNHTLSLGCLTSMYSDNLAIVEGRADVEPDDEIWILFGCPTPMILRRGSPHYTVTSPAYIPDIMNGEAVEGVVTPDDASGWGKFFRTGKLGPEIEVPYTSGKGDWLVKVISLH